MSAPVFELPAPDLGPWRQGNTGVEGVWRFEATEPGRDVLVTALVHGNELCGAWAVREALQAQLRPRRGALTLAFVNLAAFDRFDPQDSDRSRCVDHDLNRLWGAAPFEQGFATRGLEHARVTQILPFVERSQWLLDLHSMHAPGPPLGLVGTLPHHAQWARELGSPELLVADAGHRAGRRMRDHGPYADAQALERFSILVECGFHGALTSRSVALDSLARFLVVSGALDPDDVPAGWRLNGPDAPQRLLEVTEAVTVAPGEPTRFAQTWHSGQVIEKAGTLLGWNGGEPFHTPYDRCVLIMPTLVHAQAGTTLVRLARERLA